jgi:hypothetical protein
VTVVRTKELAYYHQLELAYGLLDRPVVAYGHIHLPYVRKTSKLIVGNADSVGMPIDGDCRASYLLIEGEVATVRRVEDDIDREIRNLRLCGIPNTNGLREFYRPQKQRCPKKARTLKEPNSSQVLQDDVREVGISETGRARFKSDVTLPITRLHGKENSCYVSDLNLQVRRMKDIDSPTSLAKHLIELFPPFATELQGEEITSYHQVVLRLTPVVTEYLQKASAKTVERFFKMINAMIEAGGERENAISTCLLEHASQVKLRVIIRPTSERSS